MPETATADIATGSPVLLSVRPEQLELRDVAGAGCWPVEPGLRLPLGAQLVHEARTGDGAKRVQRGPMSSAPSRGTRRD